MGKTAIIFGATGLTGDQILKALCNDSFYDKIISFSRNPLSIKHEKIEEHIVDFENFDSFKDKIAGDSIFLAMGTTIKKAKSKESQYKVDYTYQYKAAEFAAKNGTKKLLLVSSIGANEKSPVFYSKIKGKLENDIQKLDYPNIFIFRPSGLLGERKERRKFEEFGIKLMKPMSYIPFLKKYRPIHTSIIGKAMAESSKKTFAEKTIIYESDQIFKI